MKEDTRPLPKAYDDAKTAEIDGTDSGRRFNYKQGRSNPFRSINTSRKKVFVSCLQLYWHGCLWHVDLVTSIVDLRLVSP